VIKGIISKNPKWVDISGSQYSSSVYIDNHKVQQGIAGQVRHNGNDFEINDGNSWKVLYDNMVEVGLSPSAQEALAWAEKKMAVERQAEELARHNVTVKDALDTYQQRITDAEQQLKMVVSLTRDHTQSV
jgi:hypothetical protein